MSTKSIGIITFIFSLICLIFLLVGFYSICVDDYLSVDYVFEPSSILSDLNLAGYTIVISIAIIVAILWYIIVTNFGSDKGRYALSIEVEYHQLLNKKNELQKKLKN